MDVTELMSLHGIAPGTECNQIWRHKKTGNCYVLLFVARLESDGEPVAVYERVDIRFCAGDHASIWVRPMALWFEKFENCARTCSAVEP